MMDTGLKELERREEVEKKGEKKNSFVVFVCSALLISHSDERKSKHYLDSCLCSFIPLGYCLTLQVIFNE